ncbi:hypothetical protein BU25DRAFT_466745 [Macroventuria anomochaeta]|uniref:Uncharacterized protein n=1 Tax=Macroventuria anomochaeta TaxID=301207 RepID=A0ACB6S3V5_9PLEO|nr:uncharacterized protein BU25DRAFT_466745 [Macroventuria anomochaeta]KAF2628841.1 hypothetical protein BU25DRAFT_466745 [Macroventuria anomochaeta]
MPSAINNLLLMTYTANEKDALRLLLHNAAIAVVINPAFLARRLRERVHQTRQSRPVNTRKVICKAIKLLCCALPAINTSNSAINVVIQHLYRDSQPATPVTVYGVWRSCVPRVLVLLLFPTSTSCS